ncbi:Aste57867_12339 [Aphanomyces stellatus]|uniref:Aste57867_12339 protein n=1 Tax=Aphanomyces stellatus TaxID=120398 RepID=A0A485KW37_9STRA|nr:hypothetical protein As57867_012293 [Aphanomyces stellatus]VFT89191.1 Aste57867_12339 [Aphanomyces stellatus]
MSPTPCLFNDCSNPAMATGKCDKHKGRAKCTVAACFNQTYARNLCVKHGGKRVCVAHGCTANARSHGFCSKHGQSANKKRCDEPGCTKVAHYNGRCMRHGGGRKCKVADCESFSRLGGCCRRHHANQMPELGDELLLAVDPWLCESIDKWPEIKVQVEDGDAVNWLNFDDEIVMTAEETEILSYFMPTMVW